MKSMRDLIKLMENVTQPSILNENDIETYKARLDSLDRRSPSYRDEYAQLLKDMPAAHNAYTKELNDRMWAGSNWERDPKSGRSAVDEKAPPGMEDVAMKLKKEYPDDHSKAFATAWSIYNKKHGKTDESSAMQSEALAGKIVGGIAGARLAGPRGIVPGAEIGSGLQDMMNENDDYDLNFIGQSIRNNYDMATSEDELKQMVAGETGYGQNPEFDNMFYTELDYFLNGDDSMAGDLDDSMDGDFDSAMASAGHGSDEDYGDFPVDEARSSDIDPAEVNALISMPVEAAKNRAQEIIAASTTSDNKKSYLLNQINKARTSKDVTSLMYNMILAGEGNAVQGSRYGKKFGGKMEEDLNNGYNTEQCINGLDFFPNGADSPVVKSTGPSGARQGDNPEQKKMQVDEVHKELVYGYRRFLKESSK